MNPLLLALPLDKTGTADTNRVVGEVHDLSALVNLPNRCFVLDHGYFYKDSLELEDSQGMPLHEGQHYQITGNSRDLMMLTGQNVCSVIVVTNPDVGSRLLVNAQMVGGAEGHVNESIARMARTVLNTGRSVFWKNITDKPDGYRPSGHLHPMWQLYGFEGFNASARRVSSMLKRRSQNRYALIQKDFDAKLQGVGNDVAVTNAQIAAHKARKDNPHRLTAAQVVLDRVKNYGLATPQEVGTRGSAVQNKYMTPALAATSIQVNFLDSLNLHKADRNNPHRVTPAQVNAFPIGEANNAFGNKLGKYETAANTNLFAGRDFNQVYNESRANLDVSAVAPLGRFPYDIMAGGMINGLNHLFVLTGAGQWRQLPEIFNTYGKKASKVQVLGGVFGSPSDGIASISQIFADNNAYPYGTIVLFTVQDTYDIGNGNGGTITRLTSVYSAVKTPSGWFY